MHPETHLSVRLTGRRERPPTGIPALPLLRLGDKPHLIAIGSSVTYLPLPRAEAYGASKAALRYLLEALLIDLASEDIDVTVVSPGFVDTPLTAAKFGPSATTMGRLSATRCSERCSENVVSIKLVLRCGVTCREQQTGVALDVRVLLVWRCDGPNRVLARAP